MSMNDNQTLIFGVRLPVVMDVAAPDAEQARILARGYMVDLLGGQSANPLDYMPGIVTPPDLGAEEDDEVYNEDGEQVDL